MTLNFTSFIRTIKPYANNINISDEEFVTNLFDYIGPELHIVNSRNGEPLYLSKARISLLLNQKEDVSDNIRAPFCRTKAKDILTKILPDYLEDNMNPSRHNALMDSVRNLLLSDSSLDEMARKTYSSLNDMELFAVVFIEAIKANNQLCPIEKELWHSGNSSISIMSGNIISFDLKKYRIRIHKSTIHALGDPKYIHFLVNPSKRTIAIRAYSGTTPGKDAHRIKQSLMDSDNSYEIYSRYFVMNLCRIVGILEPDYGYRISGVIVPSEKMAVYSLDTITRIDA